jgi:hypothetical protein
LGKAKSGGVADAADVLAEDVKADDTIAIHRHMALNRFLILAWFGGAVASVGLKSKASSQGDGSPIEMMPEKSLSGF